MAGYLDLVRERCIVFDGAMGTNLQRLGLGPDDFGGPGLEGCNEVLVATRPDAVSSIHDAFLGVGVDVVETDSFGAFRTVLAEYGLEERAFELNERAAKLAKAVAADHSTPDHPRFVAGSMGPGTKFPTLGQISYHELRDAYEEQASGLLAGGADLLVIETVFDLLQAKAALAGARAAMERARRKVPVHVQVTVELTGRMLPGTEIAAALTSLSALRPDVIGMNCATGPREMGEHLRHLAGAWPGAISCLPNAGLPSVVDGQMHYDLGPDELADYLERFVTELGVEIVGGCCGTTPEHLAKVVERVGGVVPKRRDPVVEPSVASLYSSVPLHQDSAFLAVGERLNANGSRRFREAMLEGDWDTCVEMAREQVGEGAHVLDVCVDYTGADGVANATELVSRLATQSSLPLMLDSTEADVIEAGLARLAGRAIVNSVNLEDGDGPGTRLDRFLRLAKEFGAAVVATCIDTDGQARTADWKVRAAKAIVQLATERYGLQPSDILIDPLALPLSTGMEESRRDGIETLEAIRRIKAELPGVFTILGLSNVSFGLNPAARVVLNSVFLEEARAAGLDAAIVHAARIVPLARIDERHVQLCRDLIFDRRRGGEHPEGAYDPLAELMAAFEGAEAEALGAKEDRSGWPVERRLRQRIVDGDRVGLDDDLAAALAKGLRPLEIVNEILLDGMREVGDLFGAGKMQLPFVLASAETMKAAVAYLEPLMERSDQGGKGRIVLATVKGDVHDIGKNLVDIILTNNGWEVVNLGIKVPVSEMIAKAEEVGADAIGMSGLLVKSTLVMRENLEELNDRGLEHIPVLLGGAALTRTYVERDLRQVYKGRVFYGRDAFEGLAVMERLRELKRSGVDDPDFGRSISERKVFRRDPAAQPAEVAPEARPKRSPEVSADNPVFRPPFLGSRVARGIALEAIASYLNETALFRHQWGFRPQDDEDDAAMRARARAVLRAQLDQARAEGTLVPQVVWGYFPAASDGDDLVVFADESRREERTRFHLPRQSEPPWLCIADFFRPVDRDEVDFVAFFVVTMGRRASERARELFEANRYQDYLYLHGLGVELTEALAELWHRRIREEWGFANEDGPTLAGLFRQQYRGGRYSFGYPACPDLEDNAKVVDLLEAGRIGVEITDNFQLEPEQTTLALVSHHPQAKYFVVR